MVVLGVGLGRFRDTADKLGEWDIPGTRYIMYLYFLGDEKYEIIWQKTTNQAGLFQKSDPYINIVPFLVNFPFPIYNTGKSMASLLALWL